MADAGQLVEFAVQGALERRFVIAHAPGATAELLHRRADAIGRGELPPSLPMGL